MESMAEIIEQMEPQDRVLMIQKLVEMQSVDGAIRLLKLRGYEVIPPARVLQHRAKRQAQRTRK